MAAGAERPGNGSTAVKSGPSFKRNQTNAAMLRTVEVKDQITVDFKDVCAWVPLLFAPTGKPGVLNLLRAKDGKQGGVDIESPAKDRQVLFDITGSVSPGEVLALMGPSGSGKSSLLSILGQRSTARTTGSILFNGEPLNKLRKRKLGYVQQDDLLFAELTVYETLYYAAMLRLPRDWSAEDKVARVELVLSGLGLDKCRDTIIGNQMQRGVSGGERKRVSIGHELLINPSVIFLDEPTSGLDSTTALRLMHTLRSLASAGRTILTSIHQPSSRLYKQMDKLLLLSEGHAMYYGHSSLAAAWFELQSQPCPFGTNIADHILDLANGDVLVAGGVSVTGEDDGEVAEAHKRLVSAYEKHGAGLGPMGVQAADIDALKASATAESSSCSSTANTNNTNTNTTNSADEVAAKAVAVSVVATGGAGHADKLGAKSALPPPPQPEESTAVGHHAAAPASMSLQMEPAASDNAASSGQRWGASWVDQVKLLAVRSVKTRRFGALSWQKFAQMLVVAVLGGMFWWQVGGSKSLDTQRALDIGGLLFFIELFMAFATLFAALFTFPLEFQMLVKERQSGMYRLSAYYLARTASDLPMDCLVPTLFTWVLYFMAGLRLDAGAFFSCWFSVILLVLTAQSVGLLIGATVINPQNGQTIATIFMLATMLVGGYYVRTIPIWISWLKYTSFIYWGWNLLLKIEFRNRPFPCGPGCDVAASHTFDVDVNAPVTNEVCILIAMLIALRLCVYYALQWKTTFRKRA